MREMRQRTAEPETAPRSSRLTTPCAESRRTAAGMLAALQDARGRLQAAARLAQGGGGARRSVVEPLEGRRLMSAAAAAGTGGDDAQPVAAAQMAALAAGPSVTSTTPGNNVVNVMRDAFVSANLSVPNGGIDPASLTPATVRLVRTSDGAAVPASVNTSAGGDVLALSPSAPLDANTEYAFEVTPGLRDVAGNGFAHFVTRFRTGAGVSSSDGGLKFTKVALDVPSAPYTSVTKGPDGRLYASAETGEIYRFDIRPDGTLGPAQLIRSLIDAHGGTPRFLTGITFDPASNASDLVLWVTHSHYALDNGPDWTGKVTRLAGPDLATVQDYVVGLPRSTRDHVTNQLTFGPDGAIYFAQAGNTAMGAPDYAWHHRPERYLSAAVLRLDEGLVRDRLAAGKGPVDVRTEDGHAYDPFAPGAPLTIYASGVRNAYDLLWHSNGQLYAPTNGSQRGGATPAGGGAPGIDFVDQVETDYLLRIVPGGYYGHPNPSRAQFVRNGGNPTAGPDPYEIPQYPVGTMPDVNYRAPTYDFGQHYSPNGVIEYRGSAFHDWLRGKILVARFSGGDDVVVLTPSADGTAVIETRSGIQGLRNFNDPLDLTEDPDTGFLYIAEFGGRRLTLAKPAVRGAPAGPRATPREAPLGPYGLAVAPAAPRALSLGWVDTVGESGYEVERANADGQGGWARVATLAANATAYTDAGLARDAGYQYRVRAVNAAGKSRFAAPAAGRTTAVILPPGWSGHDVGNPGRAGAADYADGRLELLAGGTGVGGGRDSFFFAAAPAHGDVQVTARVADRSAGHAAARVGVMLRSGAGDTAPHTTMALTGSGSAEFQFRATAGAETGGGPADGAGHSWVRLVRRGDVVMGFTSADGAAWALAGWARVALGAEVLAGLAIAAHDAASVYAAVVDNVTVAAAPPLAPPEAPADLVATAAGTRAALGWSDRSIEESAFEVERRRAGAGGAWVRVAATGPDAAAFADEYLAASRKYEYRVRAVNAAGASGWSNAAAVRTGRSSVKGQAPFAGAPLAVPGTIEAEAFDAGPRNKAWKDRTPDNDGGVLRDTGVDLAPTSDAGGGYHVAAAARGEWIEYTVAVPADGAYTLELRFAAAEGFGGAVRLDAANRAVTAPITLPATGGWDVWRTAVTAVQLRAGTQVLRLSIDAATHPGGDVAHVNWLRLSGPTAAPASAAAAAPTGAPPARAPLTPETPKRRRGRAADVLFNTTVTIVP
jgi:hypothetical protein